LFAQESPNDAGPATLVITYRCTPSQRVKLRQYMRDQGLARFEEWRRNAILQNYRILFSRYVDTNNWDMLTILTFANYSDFDKWQRVERDTPAGLPAAVLDQLLYISTYPLDAVRQKAAAERPLHPTCLVVPYARTTSPQEYLDYRDRTVQP